MASDRQYQRVSNNEIPENNPISDITKRGNRAKWASGFVLVVTSALVLAFTLYNKDEVIFVPVEDIRNQTASKYFEKQVTTKCRGFFFCALTVFSVLIGTIVDRLTLVLEEIFHVKSRYGGNYWKMLKACFSGLAGKAIFFGIIFAGIVIVIYFLVIKIQFKLDYLVLVFSGIGFGPLVQRLLKLDTQSEVHISTILEEKGKLVANVLAWSYYFNDLKIVLPKIKHAIDSSRWKNRLSSTKLVILLPLDGQTDPESLPNVDQRLSKEDSITCQKNPKLSVDVLSVKCDETPNKYFLFNFASPVETLFFMSEYEKVIALPRIEREKEVAFCCQFLEKIVSDPVHKECMGRCVVIPYEQKNGRRNGWLVKKILETEDSSVANECLVVPVEIEHDDETHSQTTSNLNTNEEIATSEETRTEDIASDVDIEDQDRQNERSPLSIDNEAYMTDGFRAKRHQPNDNNLPQPSNNVRPLPNNTPPQTMSINNPRQPINTTQPLPSNTPPQTMSINNPRQPINTTQPLPSNTPPQTMSINNPRQPSNTTQPLPSNTPPQTMSINNPRQPSNTTQSLPSNTPPQTMSINNPHQPINTTQPLPSNTPPQTMSLNNPSQPSNNTPIQTSDASTQTNSINNPPELSYSTPPETSDTLPQTTSTDNPPQPSNNIPPQTRNNPQGSMNDQAQTSNPQLCLAAPQLNSGGGLSGHNETPSYDTRMNKPKGKDDTMKRYPQLETLELSNETIIVAQVHPNQQRRQPGNTSQHEVVANETTEDL